MNFPMQYPIFQFFYWLVNTPGVGGVLVLLVGGICVSAYGLTLRWVANGSQADETDTYSYPTPALHHKNEIEK